jgi:hypothetical protein
MDQWVRKVEEPPMTFDPWKERDTYKNSRKELLQTKWVASTSQHVYDKPPVFDMPLAYDHSMIERKIEKVRTLKIFLKSCL